MSKQESYDNETDRREYRRARRKRNQLIAIIVVIVVGLALVAGGILGVTQLMKQLNDKKHTEELQAQLAELADSEPAVVEAPVEEEPQELTSDDYLNQIADSCIAEMSLENKVAGLFMVTPEALTGVDTVIQAGDTTKQKLSEYPVGGLVYFSKNIKSADQLKEMLDTTRNTMIYPVFLAVDEEGGSVSRVAGAGLADDVGDMSEIGSTCDPEKAKEAGMYAYGAGGSGTETITLPDIYSYQPIGGLIPLPKIWFHNTVKVHTWNGVVYENGKDTVESQPMVYVTESGSVYHRKLGCSYLNLSVQQISGSSVKALKNAYGEKYQACELCSRGQEPAGVVYITKKSNRFHNRESCSALKRSVRMVKETEVSGEMSACGRCG